MSEKNKKTIVLIILDGWGLGNYDESNPIHFADPQTINFIQKNFPCGMLQSSGVAIGLPWEETSSSQVGHFTIGSGRISDTYSKEILKKGRETGLSPITKTLGEILANNNKIQMRIAEELRYENVTYFMNGLREESFPNEYRIQVPSEKTIHPETHPEMMAETITDRLVIALHENTFDCIVVNYANPDVIAHTGDYEATVKAVQKIDAELNKVMEVIQKENHTLIITSGHGNAESVLNLKTGETEKTNDANPVPLYLVGNEYKLKTPHPNIYHLPPLGIISDIAPTILEILNIQKPKEMTGESLLSQLK